MLAIALLLVAAAATSALSSTDTSMRDVRSKRALQAADAGLNLAVFRANQLSVNLSQLLNLKRQCLVDLNGTLGLDAGGWCPLQGENLGTGAEVTYRVSPLARVDLGTECIKSLIVCLVERVHYALYRDVVAEGRVGVGSNPDANPVTRRVFIRMEALGSTDAGLLNGLLGAIGGLNVDVYKVEPGSYRECPSMSPSEFENAENPSSGCPDLPTS